MPCGWSIVAGPRPAKLEFFDWEPVALQQAIAHSGMEPLEVVDQFADGRAFNFHLLLACRHVLQQRRDVHGCHSISAAPRWPPSPHPGSSASDSCARRSRNELRW